MVGFMGLPFPGQVRQLSWAALSTSGIPATLIALELIQPRTIRKFQRQVLGYIIISGLIGAVALTAAYTLTYLVSDHDVTLARSVLTMMAVIYGIVIFWDVREAIVGVGVAIITLAVPIVLPQMFQIAIIPLSYWIGIILLSIVSAFLLWRSTFEQTKLLAPFQALAVK
jgi:hypothetical protein